MLLGFKNYQRKIKTMYFKITNAEENHNGLQYHTGLVEDILPFQEEEEGSCVPGGIYFTDEKHIFKFLNYGIYIREVQIPEDAQFVKDPQGDKWRASKIILGERKDLRELSTWKLLISLGADIHEENDYALRFAALNGHLEVVKYLVQLGANIHADNDYALRWSALNGHLEVLKYLVQLGANIHAENDYALRFAAGKGHLEVLKYLISLGADIHAYHDFALRWAAGNGHLEVVKYLVQQGADIHANHEEALIWSENNKHIEVYNELLTVPILK